MFDQLEKHFKNDIQYTYFLAHISFLNLKK